MPEQPKSEHLRARYPTPTEGVNKNVLSSVLSYLVFQAEHVRIGLEISACVLVSFLFQITLPWTFFGVPMEWTSFASWICGCMMMVLCDRSLFQRPITVFRKARLLDIEGAYDQALRELESIGPRSSSLVSFPLTRYHLERTRFLTHARRFEDAAIELELAKDAGLGKADYHLSRFLLLKEQENVDSALAELAEARAVYGENAVFLGEEALLLIEEKKDYRAARSLLKKALASLKFTNKDASVLHLIITGYLEIARLWTGEAEEALEGLTETIYQAKSLMLSNRDLRPYVSFLLLERAYYYVTHKAPDEAMSDLTLANRLCAYPRIQRRAKEIVEELNWRFNIVLE